MRQPSRGSGAILNEAIRTLVLIVAPYITASAFNMPLLVDVRCRFPPKNVIAKTVTVLAIRDGSQVPYQSDGG